MKLHVLFLIYVVFLSSIYGEDVTLKKHIEDLGADHFKKRSLATKAIKSMLLKDSNLYKQLLKTYTKTNDPEIKVRLINCLKVVIDEPYLNPAKGYFGVTHVKTEIEHKGKKLFGYSLNPFSETPAERAGIIEDDVIIQLDEWVIKEKDTSNDFAAFIHKRRPGTKLKCKILRNDKVLSLEVELAKRVDHEKLNQEQYEQLFIAWLNTEVEKIK